MTHQAITWALNQRVPGDAGRLLITLANYTNHLTGAVDFGTEVIAQESCIAANSLAHYLAALRRNGYLGRDEKDGVKHYWLLLDRDVAHEWDWNAVEIAQENDSAPSVRQAPGLAPASFSAAAQADARAKVKPEARTEFPVIEGSPADLAWRAHLKARGQKVPFIRSVIANGQTRRGYPMPTLFPPKEQEQISA